MDQRRSAAAAVCRGTYVIFGRRDLLVSQLRRIPFALLAVTALPGSTFVSCSSGSGSLILDPNRPPVAVSASFTTAVDAPFSGFLEARDEDGDPLTFAIVTPPALGTLELTDSATGQFRYESGVVGTDSFGFRVNDGRTDSNLGTVNVTVTAALALTTAAGAPREPAAAGRSVVDPHDPSHWLWIRRGRLLESIDAGGTWAWVAPAGLDPQRDRFSSVGFAAGSPGLVYAVVTLGERAGALVLRRRYAGDEWRILARVPSVGPLALAAEVEGAERIRLEMQPPDGTRRWEAVDRPFLPLEAVSR